MRRAANLIPGAVGGVVFTAGMYIASAATGLSTLPDLALQGFLRFLPGPVIGYLIDELQHAAKVLFEASTVVAMVAALAALGAAYPALRRRNVGRFAAFVLAGVGWVLLCAVVLPVLDDGVMGLDEGGLAPLVWALLFAAYGAVLELTWSGVRPDKPTDEGRRHVLHLITMGAGGVALGFLAIRLVPSWLGSILAPPEDGVEGLSPAVTPVHNFYVVSKNLVDPTVTASDWSLSVGGLCAHPLSLALQDLRNLGHTNEYVTMECVSNGVGGLLMSTGMFTGVRLRDLVALAEPNTDANIVTFKAFDDYTESLPLSLVRSAPEILVAYDLDGAALPPEHGFPARVVVPGRYGMKGTKWLTEIALIASGGGGYYEAMGWDADAIVKTTSRFDVPSPWAGGVSAGIVALGGVAFAGTRGISAVQWSADGGGIWNSAALEPPLSPYSWTRWTGSWAVTKRGVYQLTVRARDGAGELQTPQVMVSYPSGAAGYDTVVVVVT